MFIELTDHLRCPVDHEEAYLVLLPDVVERRDVRSGKLGCPICNWEATFSDGIVDFGGGQAAMIPTTLTAEAVRTFLGVSGPGGYVALVGGPAGPGTGPRRRSSRRIARAGQSPGRDDRGASGQRHSLGPESGQGRIDARHRGGEGLRRRLRIGSETP